MLVHHPQKAPTSAANTFHNDIPANFAFNPSRGQVVKLKHHFCLFLNQPGAEIISHKHHERYFSYISSAQTQPWRDCTQTTHMHYTHRVSLSPRYGLSDTDLSWKDGSTCFSRPKSPSRHLVNRCSDGFMNLRKLSVHARRFQSTTYCIIYD